jgi:hypothetical protein
MEHTDRNKASKLALEAAPGWLLHVFGLKTVSCNQLQQSVREY